jgi:predicted anti-sigma-YlaC factor YlaD
MKPDQEWGRHWRDEDLLDRLYGMEPAVGAEAHLENCPECAARWKAFEARRTELRTEPTVGEEFLRSQRQAIWARIEDRGRTRWMGWALPSTAAVALAMAALLYRPAPEPQTEVAVEIAELNAAQPASDSEFFESTAAVAAESEPQAAQTVEGLFVGGGD